ncbi:MAG: hypothetical protein ACRDAO_07850 [Culicoidibacterales bacterium]
MSIFEVIMLTCFGAAWPFSIYRSYHSQSTNGKSIVFLLVLIVGYIAGIIHKLMFSFDYVIYLYVINAILVSIDAGLWIRNAKLEKIQQK